jgi:hypothetical protein
MAATKNSAITCCCCIRDVRLVKAIASSNCIAKRRHALLVRLGKDIPILHISVQGPRFVVSQPSSASGLQPILRRHITRSQWFRLTLENIYFAEVWIFGERLHRIHSLENVALFGNPCGSVPLVSTDNHDVKFIELSTPIWLSAGCNLGLISWPLNIYHNPSAFGVNQGIGTGFCCERLHDSKDSDNEGRHNQSGIDPKTQTT